MNSHINPTINLLMSGPWVKALNKPVDSLLTIFDNPPKYPALQEYNKTSNTEGKKRPFSNLLHTRIHEKSM